MWTFPAPFEWWSARRLSIVRQDAPGWLGSAPSSELASSKGSVSAGCRLRLPLPCACDHRSPGDAPRRSADTYGGIWEPPPPLPCDVLFPPKAAGGGEGHKRWI